VVPTWNYAAIHAYGTPRVIDDPAGLLAIVTRLTEREEHARAAPWHVTDAPAAYLDKMLRAIVGFALPIERLEGKLKLSQNRSPEDRAGVEAGLADDERPDRQAVAALMKSSRAPEPL
jgi:transcriptional regulator